MIDMQDFCRKIRAWAILLLVLLAASGVTLHCTEREVKAAGFQRVDSKTVYYIKNNGKKHTGWLKLNGKYYYFAKNGKMAMGWVKSSKGYRYFDKTTGAMYVGWVDSTAGRRFFSRENGIMKTGFQSVDGKWYYFRPKGEIDVLGIARKGFIKNSKGQYRYFMAKTFQMATGWVVSSSKGVKNRRYFDKESGIMATGLSEIEGETYYFEPSTGIAFTGGTKEINQYICTFDSKGVMTSRVKATSVDIATPTGTKTLRNYLLGAMQPVGQALYVWGGGWTDSTRKGVNPTWKQWYDSQSSSYDYNNYRDLSEATRVKGLDCSGFVGWAAYQVMHTKSGEGYGYTVVASDVGSYYKSLGWGSILTQDKLAKKNYTFKPGDVGYNSGHTWIVVGQCSDKSIVIVHSTPQAGCQLAGTPTPDGDYDSEAIVLAKKYMSRFPGYTKYDYHTSSGQYIKNGNYFRWSRKTLADPDGYVNMTAAQILADLFP